MSKRGTAFLYSTACLAVAFILNVVGIFTSGQVVGTLSFIIVFIGLIGLIFTSRTVEWIDLVRPASD